MTVLAQGMEIYFITVQELLQTCLIKVNVVLGPNLEEPIQTFTLFLNYFLRFNAKFFPILIQNCYFHAFPLKWCFSLHLHQLILNWVNSSAQPRR